MDKHSLRGPADLQTQKTTCGSCGSWRLVAARGGSNRLVAARGPDPSRTFTLRHEHSRFVTNIHFYSRFVKNIHVLPRTFTCCHEHPRFVSNIHVFLGSQNVFGLFGDVRRSLLIMNCAFALDMSTKHEIFTLKMNVCVSFGLQTAPMKYQTNYNVFHAIHVWLHYRSHFQPGHEFVRTVRSCSEFAFGHFTRT